MDLRMTRGMLLGIITRVGRPASVENAFNEFSGIHMVYKGSFSGDT